MRRIITLLAMLLPAVAALAQTPEEQADAIIAQLTLEEKASLMMNTSAPVPRLGIKGYNWWNEALHGVARNGSATVFPQPVGMAASFDDELLYEVFTAVSDEGRAKYNAARKENENLAIYHGITYWTPNINIFRDPRWGRGMETYGEDPYLTGVMGLAVVRGLQGPDDAAVRKAHACAKHYAVHSGPESGRHRDDVDVSERDLRETYLPAFRDLVVKGNVEEVMTAYQRFRGIPCGANEYLMDTVLRGEWGFKGLITSDCWAVPDFFMKGHHEYVNDVFEAAALGVHSGIDTECGATYFTIPDAVAKGLLDEKDVDRNLRRLLAARIRLGELYGTPSEWDSLSEDIVESEEHKALSLRMAEESIVLLQNKDGILPLSKDVKIALIGPNSDDREMMWGNYNPVPKETVTLKDALEQRNPGLVSFRACGLLGAEFAPANTVFDDMDMSEENLAKVGAQYGLSARDIRRQVERFRAMRNNFLPALDVDETLAKLEGIDVVVFAGGISPKLEGEEMPVNAPGFSGGDKTDINLPAVQKEVLKALHDAGKKVILVNFSGSAIGFAEEQQTCDAILQAWYPGQMGGTAIANILYGDAVPSGKLPVTFYESTDQLPDFGNYDMKGHTYRYFTGKPVYEFGYGLSYTTFKYRKPRIRGGNIVVRVRNTGKVAADEIVQVYVHKDGDSDGPVKTLRGFRRVSIPAHRSVKVKIPVTDATFEWWDGESGRMQPGKGGFDVFVGSSSADANLTKIHYTVK